MEREILVAAAKELNDVLGLSPAINLKAQRRTFETVLKQIWKKFCQNTFPKRQQKSLLF